MKPLLLSSSRMFRRGLSIARLRLKAQLTSMAVLPVILCVIGGPAPVVQAQQLSDGIAAIVNAEVIMISDLQDAMADETVRLKARHEGEAFRKRLVQKQYEVLNRMITRKLQLQEAAAKEMTVTDEEVDKAWEHVQKNPDSVPVGVARSKDAFREEMTLRRLTDFEVQRRILVPFEEIRTYYNERERQFTTPPKHRLRQILLVPKPNESRDAVRERAEDIERQLQEGATFAELAAIYSDGPTGDNGGDLEFVQKEDLLTPLGAALDELAQGERSPVIETDIGMHILLRGETREGTPQPFDTVKGFIRNQLYQQKLRRAHEAWLSSLQDKSYIDIRL